MSPELDKKLCEKYPKIFKDRDKSMMESCMFWGLDCGDGWYNIIDKMCGLIAWDIEHNKMPEVVATQVKEKFGTLSFYFYGGDKRTSGIVSMAEQMSGVMCEECGNPGEIVKIGGWVYTRCEKCKEKMIKEREERFNKYKDSVV
jgi:hypothetical protein